MSDYYISLTEQKRVPEYRRPLLARLLVSADARLFLLVLPLLLFVLATVILPVGQFLARAIDNSAIASNLPLTAAHLADWQPGGDLPGGDAFAAFLHRLEHQDDNATDEGGPRDGWNGLRQLDVELLDHQATGRSDEKGHGKLREVVFRRRITQRGRELLHALRENGQHREHRAALDHHIKEIALRRQPAEVLRDEQVAGRGDRQEFGDTFNDAEEDDREPVWHG